MSIPSSFYIGPCHSRIRFLSGVVLLGSYLIAGTAVAGPAEDYINAQLRVVRCLESQLDGLTDAADAAAAGLLSGGKLYLAGEPGMVSELAGRAGGLCGAQRLATGKSAVKLAGNDVVLFSDYGLPKQPPATTWDDLLKSDALVIAFASAENPILQAKLPAHVRAVRVDMPCDSRMVKRPNGERLIPIASPGLATAQWAFTAELIAACRRQHRQLAVYLSMLLDPGYKRLKRTTGLLFEPDLRPDPVPRKQYAGQFLAAARASLEAIRRDEIPGIRKAASWLDKAVAAQARIYRNFWGHLPPTEAGKPGDVSLFANLKPLRAAAKDGIPWIEANLNSGDVYLLVGYMANEDALAAAANAKGAQTIFLTAAPSGPRHRANPRHLYINPHWPSTDACLELPGYDVKACPLSAIAGMTCYWAICAEVMSKSP